MAKAKNSAPKIAPVPGVESVKKSGLEVVKGFRLSKPDAEEWDRKVDASGMSSSEFIRRAIIQNRTVVAGVKQVFRQSPVTLETLRLLALQGNNLNQIARHMNELRKAGELSGEDALAALRELQEISAKSSLLLEGGAS